VKKNTETKRFTDLFMELFPSATPEKFEVMVEQSVLFTSIFPILNKKRRIDPLASTVFAAFLPPVQLTLQIMKDRQRSHILDQFAFSTTGSVILSTTMKPPLEKTEAVTILLDFLLSAVKIKAK